MGIGTHGRTTPETDPSQIEAPGPPGSPWHGRRAGRSSTASWKSWGRDSWPPPTTGSTLHQFTWNLTGSHSKQHGLPGLCQVPCSLVGGFNHHPSEFCSLHGTRGQTCVTNTGVSQRGPCSSLSPFSFPFLFHNGHLENSHLMSGTGI